MSHEQIKTSVRLVDDDADTFECLRYLLGKRRHDFAAELVRSGMGELLQNADLAASVEELRKGRADRRAEEHARRTGRSKGGLTLLGGAS